MPNKLERSLWLILLILFSIPLAIIFAIFPSFRKKAINWLIKNFLNEEDKEKMASSRNTIGKIGDNSKSNQNQFGDNESDSEIKNIEGSNHHISLYKIKIDKIENLNMPVENNSQKDDEKEVKKQSDEFKFSEKNSIGEQSEELAKILTEGRKMLELLKKEIEKKEGQEKIK